MAEGSIWEALDKASHYKLSNLIAMVDVNRLGQRGPTELSWDLETYSRRASAFGARVFTIDGHDVAEIDRAMAHARATGPALAAGSHLPPRIIEGPTGALDAPVRAGRLVPYGR